MTKETNVNLHLTCDAAPKVKEKSRCHYWLSYKASTIEQCYAMADHDNWHVDGNTHICERCYKQIRSTEND